jgi:hypothetical protein
MIELMVINFISMKFTKIPVVEAFSQTSLRIPNPNLWNPEPELGTLNTKTKTLCYIANTVTTVHLATAR